MRRAQQRRLQNHAACCVGAAPAGQSAWARAQGRTSRERSRAHAEARAERRGDVAKKIAAAGATAIVANGIDGIGTQPVAAGVTLRINALYGKAGHVLH